MKVKDYPDATIKRVGDEIVDYWNQGHVWMLYFSLKWPDRDISQMKTTIEVELIADGEVIDEISTNFVGPVSKK
jgi:hypothetical protein